MCERDWIATLAYRGRVRSLPGANTPEWEIVVRGGGASRRLTHSYICKPKICIGGVEPQHFDLLDFLRSDPFGELIRHRDDQCTTTGTGSTERAAHRVKVWLLPSRKLDGDLVDRQYISTRSSRGREGPQNFEDTFLHLLLMPVFFSDCFAPLPHPLKVFDPGPGCFDLSEVRRGSLA